MQRSQGETHRAFALAVQFIGPVHFLFDVVGDRRVQRRFGRGKCVIGGDGAPVGEELAAVKAQHVFFDGAAHQVGDIDLVRTVAELAVETVRIQQRHEQLKVFFFAVVRRGRHEQKVARDGAQQFTQLKTLGFFDLVAEVAGRQFVRLIDDDQIPMGEPQLFLQVNVPGELVYPRDHQVDVVEGVARTRCFDLLARKQRERQAEFFEHFILPLIDQTARRDDQHALGVRPHQ